MRLQNNMSFLELTEFSNVLDFEKVYNIDDIKFFSYVLLRGSGCNTLWHSGLANVTEKNVLSSR